MWCGYASILFRAADQDPEGYVKFVIDLFEGGRASLNMSGPGSAEPVEADESIRTGDLPRFKDNNGKLSELMPKPTTSRWLPCGSISGPPRLRLSSGSRF